MAPRPALLLRSSVKKGGAAPQTPRGLFSPFALAQGEPAHSLCLSPAAAPSPCLSHTLPVSLPTSPHPHVGTTGGRPPGALPSPPPHVSRAADSGLAASVSGSHKPFFQSPAETSPRSHGDGSQPSSQAGASWASVSVRAQQPHGQNWKEPEGQTQGPVATRAQSRAWLSLFQGDRRFCRYFKMM